MIRLMLAGLWLLAGLGLCLLAARDGWAQSKTDKEIVKERGFGLNAVAHGPLVGDSLDIAIPAKQAGKFMLLSVDIVTGDSKIIGQDLDAFRIIAADAHRVAIMSEKPAGKIIVINRVDKSRIDRCCFPIPDAAAIFGDRLRLVNGESPDAAVVTLDLTKESSPQAVAIDRGLPVFWGDKLALIREAPADAPQEPSLLNLLGPDLQPVGTIAIPRQEARGDHLCEPESPVVEGRFLAYVSSCGRIVIVDLEALQVTQTIAYLDTARGWSLAISGDLLFAAARQGAYQVFVLAFARGHATGQLPLIAPVLLATHERLIAVYPGSRFDVFRMHRTLMEDPIDATASIVARCEQAAEALRAGATIEEAIELIEQETVKPMLNRVDALDARGRSAAAFYGRLLARSVDRIEEGMVLLDKLATASPDDAKLRDYLSAARMRYGIRGVEQAAAADLKGALEVDLGTGERAMPKIQLADDRVYVWQYADHGGSCANVTVHDRATLARHAIIAAAGCDNEMQDEVTDVAVGKDAVYIALQYRFEQKGRPDLIVLDKTSLKVKGRYDVEGGIWSLAATADGLLVCKDILDETCVMHDPTHLNAPAKEAGAVPCRPNGNTFPAVIGNPALLSIIQNNENIIACNDRWVVTGWSQNTTMRFARVDGLDKPLAVVVGGNEPHVAIGAEGKRAIVSTFQNDLSFLLRSVVPETGKVRSELSIPPDSCCNYPEVGWAVGNDTIFIGRGADLILYDLKTGRSRAYIKNVIAPKSDRIVQLILDPEYQRLILVTFDGKHSRILPLESLEAAGEDWRAADAVLAQD